MSITPASILHELRASKRIVVLGSPGSGKSTLSRILSREFELPLVSLDDLYWGPSWSRPSETEFANKLHEICQEPEWLIDGNYLSFLSHRLERADTAIFLDCPCQRSLIRVIKRDIVRAFRDKSSLPKALQAPSERVVHLSFWWFVASFNWRVRPKLIEQLNRWGGTTIRCANSADLIDLLEIECAAEMSY